MAPLEQANGILGYLGTHVLLPPYQHWESFFQAQTLGFQIHYNLYMYWDN